MDADADSIGLIVSGTITLEWVDGTVKPGEAAIGGSAVSAAAGAAATGVPVAVVGVVGTDYPMRRLAFLEERGADLAGIRVEPGQSFRWKAPSESHATVRAERGIAGAVDPRLPGGSVAAGHSILLGSADPARQRRVLDQASAPRLVGLDTAVHWIRERRGDVLDLVAQADVVFLTAVEARLLVEHTSISRAVELLLEVGPRAIVVKRGQRGAWLLERDGGAVAVPTVPLPDVRDPAGAGAAFAGAFMGVLELRGGDPGLVEFRDALRHASAVASFALEHGSIERFATFTPAELERRLASLDSGSDAAGRGSVSVEGGSDVLPFPGRDDAPA